MDPVDCQGFGFLLFETEAQARQHSCGSCDTLTLRRRGSQATGRTLRITVPPVGAHDDRANPIRNQARESGRRRQEPLKLNQMLHLAALGVLGSG